MAKKRNRPGLGRGLGDILGDSAMKEISGITEIPVKNIETNPFQPRNEFDTDALNELADSIKKQGIIQPITVRKLDEKQFQLISGERRLRASKLAGLSNIPAYVRTADDEQMLEMALIENIQREDLNAVEIALSYQRMVDELGLKQEELGEKVGKSRESVANYLRLLKLPPEIQLAIRDKIISYGHARALITIKDPIAQLDLFQRIRTEGLSVRQVEALKKELTKGKNKAEKQPSEKGNSLPTQEQLQLEKLSQKLEDKFGNKVKLSRANNGTGEIKIHYSSTKDLNRILEILDIN